MNRFFLTGVLLFMALPTFAQERQQRQSSRPVSMYRLNFTLHIIEGGKDYTREYTLVLTERSGGKIRALAKVRVLSGNETTYVETGIKCDALYLQVDGGIRLETELQYSDLGLGAQPASDSQPIHEWQARVEATISDNAVTTIATYNGGEGGRRYQLDVKTEKLR